MIVDKIGRTEYVDKVCELIKSLKTDQHFCLAVNGDWGSGKTFVMEMICERLSKKEEYLVIKYDAWENSFYNDPLIAILSCIIDGINSKFFLKSKLKNAAKQLIKTAEEVVPRFFPHGEELKDIIKGIKDTIQTFSDRNISDQIKDFKSYQSLLIETKGILNKITVRKRNGKKQPKLVILVDEIDRCLPDEQLKILERIHHLLDIKNCVVIVAMNQTGVAKTVHKIYDMDGYEYLKKFFDYNYKLVTSSDFYLKSLLEELAEKFEKINNSNGQQKDYIITAFACIKYGENSILDKIDNREITRWYNCILTICNAMGWHKITSENLFFIIIGSFIRRNIDNKFPYKESIITNQSRLNEDYDNLSYADRQKIMPYYDYIFEYLGIDRENISDYIYDKYKGKVSSLPSYSWSFNEIIYYAFIESNVNNQMRRFNNLPPIYPDICLEMCQLITLYSGEQESCNK